MSLLSSNRHIIWDWNGTLLDDFALVLEAVNSASLSIGRQHVSADDYKTHYQRPVKRFYESLNGSPISQADWLQIDQDFHNYYTERVLQAPLFPHVSDLLAAVSTSGQTQSLLSMAPNDHLHPTVAAYDLSHHFQHIQGLSGTAGSAKAEHLGTHLDELVSLGIGTQNAVMIGDTPDDAIAAREHNIPAVLFNGGSHHREHLEAVGVPVVDTLEEAIMKAGTL